MRLIDADKLKAFYKHWDSEYSGEELKEYKRIFDDIVDRQETADAVPVIRCKDCKYWQDNNGGYPHEDCKWNRDETPDEDDYCSGGERKEETKC